MDLNLDPAVDEQVPRIPARWTPEIRIEVDVTAVDRGVGLGWGQPQRDRYVIGVSGGLGSRRPFVEVGVAC